MARIASPRPMFIATAPGNKRKIQRISPRIAGCPTMIEMVATQAPGQEWRKLKADCGPEWQRFMANGRDAPVFEHPIIRQGSLSTRTAEERRAAMIHDNHNIVLLTDSYKISHHKLYPPNMRAMYSYFESRGGDYKETVFFGLQAIIDKYLAGRVVTTQAIDDAESYLKDHLPYKGIFNRKGWEYIRDKYDGRLPVVIKAVKEGTVVPTHNVLMTVETTDPKCAWLTNYLETLLTHVWYSSTVATHSREMKKILLEHLEKSGTPEQIHFKLHDFGFRGVSSVETAGAGGAAHLVNFMGTDTTPALSVARHSYDEWMGGFSIPATEHSTVTSWGDENEVKAMANMLEQFPDGIVACVSDSYDIYRACKQYWGDELKGKILDRKGTVVIRPDSGDPTEVLPKLLEILGEQFKDQVTVNKRGYKVLPPEVRLIQGDGVELGSLGTMLDAIEAAGWSADNIAFGSGGGLLQKLNRDTSKYAFKCSYADVNGKEIEVYKDPVTDKGKKSKRGRLKLVKRDGAFKTLEFKSLREALANREQDYLEEAFRVGESVNRCTFASVREGAELPELKQKIAA